MVQSFRERFTSSQEVDEDYPPCWGTGYDVQSTTCYECPKRQSCRGESQRTSVYRRQPFTNERPFPPKSYYGGQQADPHRGASGRLPREGEGYGERLGKNILAAIIRAIANEILAFFSRWQF